MGTIIAVDFSVRRRASARPKVQSAWPREADDALMHSLRNAMVIYVQMLTWWGMCLPHAAEVSGLGGGGVCLESDQVSPG